MLFEEKVMVSMGVNGVFGIQRRGGEGMVLVFGSLLKRAGSCFPGISTLNLVEDLGFDFGVIRDGVIRL